MKPKPSGGKKAQPYFNNVFTECPNSDAASGQIISPLNGMPELADAQAISEYLQGNTIFGQDLWVQPNGKLGCVGLIADGNSDGVVDILVSVIKENEVVSRTVIFACKPFLNSGGDYCCYFFFPGFWAGRRGNVRLALFHYCFLHISASDYGGF